MYFFSIYETRRSKVVTAKGYGFIQADEIAKMCLSIIAKLVSARYKKLNVITNNQRLIYAKWHSRMV